MEKLILKCGRFVAAAEADEQTRLGALESYLALFASEMEFLLPEMQKALDRLATEKED